MPLRELRHRGVFCERVPRKLQLDTLKSPEQLIGLQIYLGRTLYPEDVASALVI